MSHLRTGVYVEPMNFPFRGSAFAIAISSLLAHPSRADTIQPTSGPEVVGTVVKYANNNFEVRAADGKTRNFSSTSLKRIVFDVRPTAAKIVSRTKGALEGRIAAYDHSGFEFTGPAGAERLPVIFVERVAFGGDRGPAIEVISKGKEVDLAKHLVPGSVTIVDFYADWCGPCRQISPTLEQIARADPEVALRKIDIVNWESAVVKQYKVQSIPRIEIYSRTGKLVGTAGGGAADQVRKYVAQAKL